MKLFRGARVIQLREKRAKLEAASQLKLFRAVRMRAKISQHQDSSHRNIVLFQLQLSLVDLATMPRPVFC